jgi:hypothetical protein
MSGLGVGIVIEECGKLRNCVECGKLRNFCEKNFIRNILLEVHVENFREGCMDF